jgi:hypothetical protein
MTKSRNDGVFYMDWDNFVQYFSSIEVCYFRANYQHQSLNLCAQRTKALYFQVDILKDGEYYFIAH